MKKIKIYNAEKDAYEEVEPIVKTEEEWKKELPVEICLVAREHGTERVFTGAHDKNYKKGIYKCVVCKTDLFRSDHKYDSGSGWPSFWQPIAPENIGTSVDDTLFDSRIEVHCARCQSHLGHIFDDGPPPTHKRFCLNSVVLEFVEQKSNKPKIHGTK